MSKPTEGDSSNCDVSLHKDVDQDMEDHRFEITSNYNKEVSANKGLNARFSDYHPIFTQRSLMGQKIDLDDDDDENEPEKLGKDFE